MSSVTIYADYRERGVIDHLQTHGIPVVVKNLLIGDFDVVKTVEDVVVQRYVIERKTWADHCSSIQDGRRREQMARAFALQESDPTVVYVVVVEGTVADWAGKTGVLPNSNGHAALVKSSLRDHVPLFYTASASATSQFILYVSNALVHDGLKQSSKAASRTASGYAGVVHHASKRKNMDANQFAVMLTSLSGVSGKKAEVIVETYPTALALVDAFKVTHPSKRAKVLADLKDGDRRLGDVLGERIAKAFGF